MKRNPTWRAAAFAALCTVLTSGCARPAAPSADARQRPVPDLTGRAVMLLPVQAAIPTITLPQATTQAVPLSADRLRALDAELGYWLTERVPGVRWLASDAIDRAVRQSPLLDVRVRELTVRDFQRARLEMIGDPLYGELRRVGALMDARVALLPVGALWAEENDGVGRIHLAVAIIDTFGGDVVWYGIVAGTPGSRTDAVVIASVAQALAQLITP